MAIIVTKHGDRMLHVKCTKCGCEFLYQFTDIVYDYDRINAYDSELKCKYVRCPECNAVIGLD